MRLPPSCRPLLAATLLALSLQAGAQAQAAAPSALEELMLSKDFKAFQARAAKAAAGGSAEANFLMGKAYHVGIGVPADSAAAVKWYRAALKLGSARAAHNLGLIELDAENYEQAVDLFERALAMGLTMPTLLNLGRAHSPPTPQYPQPLAPFISSAEKSASYFEQAYALDQSRDSAAFAGREYFKALDYARIAVQFGRPAAVDLAQLRARAVKWLTIGIDKGSTAAATNMGTLLMGEGRKEDARAVFRKAAAGGQAIAHYQLAKMDEGDGNGEAALGHYEAAARLGLEEAQREVLSTYRHRLGGGGDADAAKVKLTADRLAEIEPTAFAEEIDKLRKSHAWLLLRDAEQARAAALPPLPLRLNACGLLEGQPNYRPELSLSLWMLTALARGDNHHRELDFNGSAAKGCARLHKPLPASVRKMVADGAILALDIGGYTLPLKMVVGPKEITLELYPPDAAISESP